MFWDAIDVMISIALILGDVRHSYPASHSFRVMSGILVRHHDLFRAMSGILVRHRTLLGRCPAFLSGITPFLGDAGHC
ncbi:hypothetical protein GKZ89_18250 [Bacillus mangrovi]|uniref:Uncharacterized protein n=1 Tax=Metabacillus mangrovi TaxID=1491830 RepID=A0A7X2S7W1_9BACI|nr:hypothetical protein [Metabacillus mangrovi]MTH55339.1 hypothetical protein [Metabacillus mangrovi]